MYILKIVFGVIGRAVKFFLSESFSKSAGSQHEPKEIPQPEQQREYSEFERRRALQQLHEWMTPKTVAQINQDFIYRRRDSMYVNTLWGMLETIRDPEMSEETFDKNTLSIVQAVRRGDVEMLGYLFNERFKEGSELYNYAYDSKLKDIAYGRAKPTLTIV